MSSALSDAQLWSVVTGAGWSGENALKAFAIALAESGGRPDAYNGSNRNGSADHGLFQINSVHKDLLASGNWRDPVANASMAKSVYDRAGQKFTPWVAYNSGSYMSFMARAQKASVSGGGAPTYSTQTVGNTDGNTGETSTSDSIKNATAGSTWVRISYFTVGAVLLFIFAISVIKNTSIGKVATSAIPVTRVLKVAKGVGK